MKYVSVILFVMIAACSSTSVTDIASIRSTTDGYVAGGHFTDAENYLKSCLEMKDVAGDAVLKKEVEFEIDRLARIKQDFPYTKEDLLEQAKKRIKDFSESEFDEWKNKGLFDIQIIEGVEHFPGAAISNLFFRSAELYKRRLPEPNPAEYENSLYAHCKEVKNLATKKNTPYVMPVTYNLNMKIAVRPGNADEGELVRCWIPFPREYPYQKDISLINSAPEQKKISAPDYPARSVYMEQNAVKDQPAEFAINYRFTRYGVWFDIDPAAVTQEISDQSVLKFTKEQPPHVLFTKKVKDLAQEIIGSETNPFLKVKLIYDWIAKTKFYSYMIEYSTIRNIPEYIIDRGYGDCGVHALLFITLCRCSGVPARWQSALYLKPDSENIHDWTEYYVEPYGWIPCDPDFGMEVMQHFKTLPENQKKELHDFYLTGLDNFRMTANADHCQKLDPPKMTFRSDNVDFQRGEVETPAKNIYFGKYRYRFNVSVEK